MIALERTRGILVAVAIVGAGLLADRLMIQATSPWWPEAIRNDWARCRVYFREMAAPRLAGLAGQAKPDDRPVGLFVGSSTLEYDVETAAIGSMIDPGLRWVSMISYAATTAETDLMTELALRGGLRPRIVVVTTEVRRLARNPSYRYPGLDDSTSLDPGPMLASLRSARWGPAAREAAALASHAYHTALPGRLRAASYNKAWGATARLRLLDSLGQPLSAIFEPDPDPWTYRGAPGQPADQPPPDLNDQQLREIRDDLVSSGAFDATLYDLDRPAARSLVSAVRRAREAGARVVVLVLPDSRFVLDRTPTTGPLAMERLSDELREIGGVEVHTFRDAIPDRYFRDANHLRPEGKRLFTRAFRERWARREAQSPHGDRLASSPR